jgi:hypothetical protein
MKSQPSAFSWRAVSIVSSMRHAALDPLDAAEAHAHRLVARPHRATGLEHLERKAPALLSGAAVLVGPHVADRRQELAQEIAVRAVDLDDVEA